MNRTRTLVFFMAVLWGYASLWMGETAIAATPHVVHGSLSYQNGSIPGNDIIGFEAYVGDRSGDILTNVDTGWGYQNGKWWLEVGNFEADWDVGEILYLTFHNSQTEEDKAVQVELNGQGHQTLSVTMTSPQVENQSPNANAGPDQYVVEGTIVYLNGVNSSDPDGVIEKYEWAVFGASNIDLTHNGASAQFTAPQVGPEGLTLTVTLTVTDDGGLTDSDSAYVTVIDSTAPVNHPPTANAGPDQTVNPGDEVFLDGSQSSDPEGSLASFIWTQTQGDAVELATPDNAQTTFVVPQEGFEGQTLAFQLTVKDAVGYSAQDVCLVYIAGIPGDNGPPIANAGMDQIVEKGETVILDGSLSSDPNNNIVTYEWYQMYGPSVTLDDPEAMITSFVAPEDGAEGQPPIVFGLQVTDSGGLTSTDACVIQVIGLTNANQPPQAEAGPIQTVKVGDIVQLDGSMSTDPDNFIIEYHWVQIVGESVELSDPDEAATTFVAPDVGYLGQSLVFRLTVRDVGGLSASDTCIINIEGENQPPTANAGEDQTVQEGEVVQLSGSMSSDPDGDVLTYTWTEIHNKITLTSPNSENPTFIAPAVGEAGASFTFQLTVTDADGLMSRDTCIVNVTWSNIPPVADAGSDQSSIESYFVALDGSNSYDPDGEAITVQWTQKTGTPVSLFKAQTLSPSFIAPGTPPDGEMLEFELTVEDERGLKSSDSVLIWIRDNGITGFPDDVITVTTTTGQPIGFKIIRGGYLVSWHLKSPDSTADSDYKPEDMPYGMLTLVIKPYYTGGTVYVAFYLPDSAPEDYQWFVYSDTIGWYDYDAFSSYNDARDEWYVMLMDGGAGDEDEIRNDRIVVSAGLGYLPDNSKDDDDIVREGKGPRGGNCFIESSAGLSGSMWGFLIVIPLIFALLTRFRGSRFMHRFHRFGIKLFLGILVVSLGLGGGRGYAETFTFHLDAGFNGISLPYSDTGITTAEELVTAIPGCDLVKYWDETQQAFVEHEKGTTMFDFEIIPAAPYFVRVSGDTAWMVEGQIRVGKKFNLTTTETTNINDIALPIDRTDIPNAEALAGEIPNCDAVWDYDNLDYIGHPKGSAFNDFSVSPGRAYLVSVTANGEWGEDTSITIDKYIQTQAGSSVEFTIEIPGEILEELTPPLTYEITAVKKDGLAVQVPENVSLNADTGAFSWAPTSAQTGVYLFQITVTDSLGDTTIRYIQITVETGGEQGQITNVALSRQLISPAAAEECTLSYTLSHPAAVTIELYEATVQIDANGDGQLVKTLALTLVDAVSKSAGENTETLTGKNASGELLDSPVYIVVIKAQWDIGGESVYDPEYDPDALSVTHTGVSPTAIDPYDNQRLTLTYTLSAPGWVTIGLRTIDRFPLEGQPRLGGENVESIVPIDALAGISGQVVFDAKAIPFPENAIVIEDHLAKEAFITKVTPNPYVIYPAYAQVSTIDYTIAEDATVTVSVSDADGLVKTLVDNVEQTAGDYSVIWDGTDNDGSMVWPGSAETPEGDYTVRVTVTTTNGKTGIRTANIHVYR